jgi:hypothetical protein
MKLYKTHSHIAFPRTSQTVTIGTSRASSLTYNVMLDCSLLPPGQPSKSLDGYRHLGELKALSQRNISVEKRAERIQRNLEQNAKDLGARDPRNTVLAKMKSMA